MRRPYFGSLKDTSTVWRLLVNVASQLPIKTPFGALLPGHAGRKVQRRAQRDQVSGQHVRAPRKRIVTKKNEVIAGRDNEGPATRLATLDGDPALPHRYNVARGQDVARRIAFHQ